MNNISTSAHPRSSCTSSCVQSLPSLCLRFVHFVPFCGSGTSTFFLFTQQRTNRPLPSSHIVAYFFSAEARCISAGLVQDTFFCCYRAKSFNHNHNDDDLKKKQRLQITVATDHKSPITEHKSPLSFQQLRAMLQCCDAVMLCVMLCTVEKTNH